MTLPLRTVSELVKSACATDDLVLQEPLLSAAAAQAADLYAWKQVVEGCPPTASRSFRSRLAEQALAFARADEEIWIFNFVSIFQAHELDSMNEALETIRAAELMLLERATLPGFLLGDPRRRDRFGE